MSVTNRGKLRQADVYYRGATPPTQFNLALVTTVPTVDTNLLSELTEMAPGNGYVAGGITVARNATDWPSLVEDDTLDLAELTMVDKEWLASGGPLPASGADPVYAVLTDNNATVANREVLAFWTLGGPAHVSSGQPLKIQGAKIRLKQPAA